jgi:hypothetical protein
MEENRKKLIGLIEKLAVLLKEYDAELFADDYYNGYPECGQDIKISLEIGEWDEVFLGTRINTDDLVKLVEKLKLDNEG